MQKILSGEDRFIFLASMLLSGMLWLLITLSQTYSTQVTVPVSYANLPSDKVLAHPLPDKLLMYVKSSGINLLWYFTLSGRVVQIDYNRLFGRKVNTFNLVNQFSAQLSNVEIQEIKPDTIYFVFEKKAEKRVPVKMNYDITTNPAFDLKTVLGKPDSILVTGPASFIDTLTQWPSNVVKYRHINQNYSGKTDLLQPALSSVILSAYAVDYTVTVEEFTEKTLSIPIEKLNLPADISLFMYPQNATVVFQVGISEFDQIEPYYFKAVANFEKTDFKTEKQVPVLLVEKPINVRNVRFSPQVAEFMIISQGR